MILAPLRMENLEVRTSANRANIDEFDILGTADADYMMTFASNERAFVYEGMTMRIRKNSPVDK
jgi:hypothetical protein